MEDIQAVAGPIAQRHFEKVEAERRALQEKLDAEAASRKAEEDAKRAAAEQQQQHPQGSEGAKASEQPPTAESEVAINPKDEEMIDLHTSAKEPDGMT